MNKSISGQESSAERNGANLDPGSVPFWWGNIADFSCSSIFFMLSRPTSHIFNLLTWLCSRDAAEIESSKIEGKKIIFKGEQDVDILIFDSFGFYCSTSPFEAKIY